MADFRQNWCRLHRLNRKTSKNGTADRKGGHSQPDRGGHSALYGDLARRHATNRHGTGQYAVPCVGMYIKPDRPAEEYRKAYEIVRP